MIKTKFAGHEIFVEESEHYLQANDISITDINVLWEQMKIYYENYDVMFCYHNTKVPVGFMSIIGAVLVDDCVEMRLAEKYFKVSDIYNVVQVTEIDFEAFAAFHDERNPEMYWTSERIKKDLNRWGIFMLSSGSQIASYILIAMWNPTQAEIFCVETTEHIQGEALIAAASAFAFEKGKTEVLYMADENTIAHKAALAIGFHITGYYQGYEIKSRK